MLLAGGLIAAARAEPVMWHLDARRSTLEVAVRSTFEGFLCRVVNFDAAVAMDETLRRIERAEVSFDLTDVKTGRVKRDAHLLEWSEYDRFAKVTFHLADLSAADDGTFTARGSVMFHGVEKNVTFQVRSLVQGNLHSIDGEATVDYRDFGLPVIRRFYVVTVNPRVWIKFHLQGWLGAEGREPAWFPEK